MEAQSGESPEEESVFPSNDGHNSDKKRVSSDSTPLEETTVSTHAHVQHQHEDHQPNKIAKMQFQQEKKQNDVPPILSILDATSWVHILSFLPFHDILEVMCTCKTLYSICQDSHLYATLIARHIIQHPSRKHTIPYKHFMIQAAAQGLKQSDILRSMLPMLSLKQAKWIDVDVLDAQYAMPNVEGHAMAIVSDRYLVIRTGFLGHGPVLQTAILDLCPNGSNSGDLANTNSERLQFRWLKVEEPMHLANPVYGHTLTPLPDGTLLQYGGCQMGGYYGAVNSYAFMSISINEETNTATVTWQDERSAPLLNPEYGIGTTSYHCATPIPNDPFKVIFFGGIDSTYSISRLALLDCKTRSWVPLAPPEGDIPDGRYGFAHGIVNNRFWILGGANGDNIRTNGKDLRDAYYLNLDDLLERNMVIWHKSPSVAPSNMFGRETSSVVYGTKIVALGGSINDMACDEITNHLHYFDTETEKFGTISSYEAGVAADKVGENHEPSNADEDIKDDEDDEDGPLEVMPPCHLSSEAVIFGKYLIAYGGWTSEGMLDGPYVANLCLETIDEGDVIVNVETDKDEENGRARSFIVQLMQQFVS